MSTKQPIDPSTDSNSLADWPKSLNPRQIAFLETFSRLGSVSAASHRICNRISHYRWLEDEVYAQAFNIAQALFGDYLKAVAIDRAINGVLSTKRKRPLGASTTTA